MTSIYLQNDITDILLQISNAIQSDFTLQFMLQLFILMLLLSIQNIQTRARNYNASLELRKT